MSTTTSLYQRYLVADQISKRMEAVGALRGTVIMHDNGTLSLGLSYRDGNGWKSGGHYSPAAEREEIVNAFLLKYPDAILTKEKDYSGKPQMIVRGVASHGIEWEIDFRDTACELVQTGTKTVTKTDPEALAALAELPQITVEEPVFEYKCQGWAELEGVAA